MTTHKFLQAFYSIDYDEGDISTYRGIDVKFDNEVSQRYEEGNLIVDWYEMQRDFIAFGLVNVVASDSVDRFFIDDSDDKFHLYYFDNQLELVHGKEDYLIELVGEPWMTCYKDIKEYRLEEKKYEKLINTLDSFLHKLDSRPTKKRT